MRVRDIDVRAGNGASVLSGMVEWEDTVNTPASLEFSTSATSQSLTEQDWGDAFLTACFPLAVFAHESRLRIEAPVCPMLIEGLATAQAWWSRWENRALHLPTIEPGIRALARHQISSSGGATAFLSGGVDSLHMLLHNHRVYRPGDSAYIRRAIFVHGFDIGRRQRDPQEDRFTLALAHLRDLANSAGLELATCRTNLRHRPLPPGFWLHRYNGAALAAVGHAAVTQPGWLFIAATGDIANLTPLGSHPVIDPLFSSQRLKVVHEGARFTRLQKVRDLVGWPGALENLRVCADAQGLMLNCGTCEKCLRTRIELMAVGCMEAPTFGPTSVDPEQMAATEISNALQGAQYRDLVRPLEARGLSSLARVITERLEAYASMDAHQVGWKKDFWFSCRGDQAKSLFKAG
jgi:hypothetical protein